METYTAINILNDDADLSQLKREDFYVFFIVKLKSICSVHRKKSEEYILEVPK